MHSRLIAKVSEQTGLAYVRVSHDDMWELVEHLSSQRSAVNYTHQADFFTVTFLHLGAAAAQRLLNDLSPSEGATNKALPLEAYFAAATMP
jgi:hypothetical protein